MTDQNVFDLELYNLRTKIELQSRFIDKQFEQINSLRLDLARSRYNKVRWYDVTQLIASYTGFLWFVGLALLSHTYLSMAFEVVVAVVMLFQFGWVVRGMLK